MNDNLKKNAARFATLASRLRRLGGNDMPSTSVEVSPSHLPLIEYVATNVHCGIRTMAKALGLSTPTVSISVRQLEKNGLIERKPNPHDGRAVQLSLSAKGKEAHKSAQNFHRRKFEKLLSGLTPDERENLVSLFEKALNAAEKIPEEKVKE